MMAEDFKSLILCQSDPLTDAYLKRTLSICLDTLHASDLYKDATVILTGSLARGEGSVIADCNDLYSLSDMEFLVSLENSNSCARLVRELKLLEDEANRAITAAGIHCKAEFTYALQRYYTNASPSIFAFELKTHGKLVQGDRNLLALIPQFQAKDIPCIDAFYLLCNRMVEQLELLRSFLFSNSRCSEQTFRYSILKGYVDLATSVLVFTRKFEPSYQGRRDSFCKSILSFNDDALAMERLKERVDYWTRVKLNPSSGALCYLPEESPYQEWRELASMVSLVWKWELYQLTGGTADNPANMLQRFKKIGSFRQNMRSRLKFLLTALRRKELTISKMPFFAGNPRHILYAEVGDLYLRIAQNSAPLDLNSTAALELSGQIENIVHIWEVYFRNA